MTVEPAPDRAWVRELQADDPLAMNRVVERWQRPLLSFAYRYAQNVADAQDLVAETLARLYHQRQRLRPDTRLSAWLFTTLANLCHNHHRWRRRHPTVALEAASAAPDDIWGEIPVTNASLTSPEPSPDAALASAERLLALRAALDSLPHELKATLLLHHYERLSCREIAAVMSCSERGVETRLYRARRLLRSALERPLRGEPSEG